MPSEEIEKFRILESRKNYESADEWLRNFEEATWDEVRTFVRFYCPPGEEMHRMFLSIRDWERTKKRPAEIRNTPSGFLEDDLSVAMAYYRATLDHLSLVGSFVRPTGYTDAISWSILSPNYFLGPFTKGGVSGGFLTITARPRMGKTCVGCLYGEMWLHTFPGCEVLTNVPLERSVDRVRPAVDMISLLEGVADALIARRRWLWEFDEPSLSKWMKADAPTSLAKNLERFARIIPKLGGSFIYIEQREEGVPSTISDFAQSHIYCTNPGSIFADLPDKRMAVHHVPKPKIMKYRTGEAGMFEIPLEFPWDDLFRALKFDPWLNMIEDVDASTQGERIRRFLAKLTEEERARAPRPAVRCRFCRESWIPKSDEPPARCPRCMRRNPIAEPPATEEPREAEGPPVAG